MCPHHYNCEHVCPYSNSGRTLPLCSPWRYSAGGMQIIHRLVGAWQAKGFVRRLVGASEVAKAISTHPDMVVLSLAESTVPSHWLRDFLINLFQHSPALTPLPLSLIGEVVPNAWLPGYSPRYSFIQQGWACTMSVSLQCTQSLQLQLLICNHHGTDWLSIQSESSLQWFKDMEDEFDRKEETGN